MKSAKLADAYECAFQQGASGFEALMRRAQRAYVERDLETYMAAWRPFYRSFSVDGDFEENLDGLRQKLEREFGRYRINRMDFAIKKLEIMGNTGVAVLEYSSELEGENVRVTDERTNLILAEFDGKRWWLVSKIIIRAQTNTIRI